MAKKGKIKSVNYFENKKKQQRRIKILLACLIILIVVLMFSYKKELGKRIYKGYKSIKTIEDSESFLGKHMAYKSGFIKYSQNGAVAIDSNGEELWNVSYEMQDPIAETSGEYAVIADRGSRSFSVINGKGKTEDISTLHNIEKVKLANQGVVAVLMEGNSTSYITLYDLEGEVLIDKAFDANKYGLPMDIALSFDGAKLLTSYTSIKTGALGNALAFYNYSGVGKNYAQRLVGGVELKGEIVPRVQFINNDTVSAFKENGFILYSVKEKPEEIITIEFEEKIKSIIYNDSYIGCVLEKGGENISRQILLYDLSGKKVLDKDLDYHYDNITLYEKEIILYDSLSVVILNLNGKVKFEQKFESNISLFLPGGEPDQYFLIKNNELMKIKLLEKN